MEVFLSVVTGATADPPGGLGGCMEYGPCFILQSEPEIRGISAPEALGKGLWPGGTW